MSDSRKDGPRRAAFDEDPFDPSIDDTGVDGSSGSRHVADDDFAVDDYDANPFARPQDNSPVLPLPDDKPLVETTFGRRMLAAPLEEEHEEPEPPVLGPQGPRRSASSTVSPPDIASSPSSAKEGWTRHHKKPILRVALGVLTAALVFVLVGYGVQYFRAPGSPDSASSDPGNGSASPIAGVGEEQLLSPETAKQIDDKATWTTITTATTRAEAELRPACLGTVKTDHNPTIFLQRSLGTTNDDGLAALHQVEVYASAEAATASYQQNLSALAGCTEVPARIVSAASVAGLADDALQLTVVFENNPAEFHSILLSRTGKAITILDVARNSSAVAAANDVAGLKQSLSEICEPAAGTCPSDPKATNAIPPATDPVGWLTPSDLPRITTGSGLWTMTEAASVTSKGTGCENMPLATESGPQERRQRTYLLSQDNATPASFGLDQLVFEFAKEADAKKFGDKLISSLGSCKERLLTAEVAKGKTTQVKGQDNQTVNSTTFTLKLTASGDKTIYYQAIVSVGKTRVSYVLVSVTDKYQFSTKKIEALATRVAQRLTQSASE